MEPITAVKVSREFALIAVCTVIKCLYRAVSDVLTALMSNVHCNVIHIFLRKFKKYICPDELIYLGCCVFCDQVLFSKGQITHDRRGSFAPVSLPSSITTLTHHLFGSLQIFVNQ